MSLALRNQRTRLHSTLSAFHQGLDVVSTGNSYRVSSVPANRYGTPSLEQRQEQNFLFLINKQVRDLGGGKDTISKMLAYAYSVELEGLRTFEL